MKVIVRLFVLLFVLVFANASFAKKLKANFSYYTFNTDNDKKNIILKNNIDDIDLDEIYNFIEDGKKFIKSIMNTLLLNNY